MKLVDTLKRSGRNLRQAKIRTLLTALAIAVGGFTLTLTLAAALGAQRYADNLIEANFDPNSVMVTRDESFFGAPDTGIREYDESLGAAYGAQFHMLDREDIAALRAMDNVGDVTEGYMNDALFVTREGAGQYTAALYVYDPGVQPELKAGTLPETGDLADGTVVMPEGYLEFLEFESSQAAIGETLHVHVQRATGETQVFEFTIAAVSTRSVLQEAFEPTALFLSRNDSQAVHDFVNAGTVMEGRFLYAMVMASEVSADELKEELEEAGFVAMTATDAQEFLTQIIGVLQGIVVVFGLIALIASFFGVVNTQYISVLERTREIGLMKALGASKRVVSRLFIVEATWIGFLGAAIGSLTAMGLGAALNPWISEQLNLGDERLLVFAPAQIIGLIVFLMLVTTVAGLLPARKAAKLDPIEALRTE